jgi:hypothetical protein
MKQSIAWLALALGVLSLELRTPAAVPLAVPSRGSWVWASVIGSD